MATGKQQRWTGGVANHREMSRCLQKRGNAGVHTKAPPPLAVITERADPSLVTQCWISGKQCLMIVDTRAYVTSSGLALPLDGPKDN
jgi:hypothetical protein